MWEEAKPLNSKKIRKIAALALAFLLLYVGYQGYMATHQSLKTETAMYGQVSDVLQVDGFVIRNETVVEDSYNGVLSYRVGDGTRVSTGGVIADIFASESDAAAYGEVESLNREIENLQALSQPADFFVANPTMLSDQIYAAVDQISVAINQNNFSDLTTLKEELQTALSRRQLITGEETPEDFSQRISSLESQRDALQGQAGSTIGTITAPAAGYFISSVDGLETAVDVDQVEDLTVSQVEDLLQLEETEQSDAVGKICRNFNWYVACVLDEDDMVRLEGVENVSLDIPFASSEAIPATVVATNTD